MRQTFKVSFGKLAFLNIRNFITPSNLFRIFQMCLGGLSSSEVLKIQFYFVPAKLRKSKINLIFSKTFQRFE
jgi:hypothetical protein